VRESRKIEKALVIGALGR